MLTLLHTAQSNVAVFDALWQELAPDIEIQHLVADDILQEARDTGRAGATLSHRVAEIYATLGKRFEFVLCTCSTIGEIAERASVRYPFPVLRIDRPMATRAVELGERIAVLATLKSTLEPTRDLLKSIARKVDKQVYIDDVLCADAWEIFERGDVQGYAESIARMIDAMVRTHDVIVLAQASMAVAAELRPNCPIPILSSPRMGFEAAVAQYREYHAALQKKNAAAQNS